MLQLWSCRVWLGVFVTCSASPATSARADSGEEEKGRWGRERRQGQQETEQGPQDSGALLGQPQPASHTHTALHHGPRWGSPQSYIISPNPPTHTHTALFHGPRWGFPLVIHHQPSPAQPPPPPPHHTHTLLSIMGQSEVSPSHTSPAHTPPPTPFTHMLLSTIGQNDIFPQVYHHQPRPSTSFTCHIDDVFDTSAD